MRCLGLVVVLAAGAAGGTAARWTAADVERITCNGRSAVRAPEACAAAGALPFGQAELREGARVALVLAGQVRTFLEEPLGAQWRQFAASAAEARVDVAAIAVLGHAKGFREARVAEFFEAVGLPCRAAFVNVDGDAVALVEDARLLEVLARPHHFQQGGEGWRRSAPIKRLVALDALLRWERDFGERFRSVVVARPDVMYPGLLADGGWRPLGAPAVSRLFSPERAFLMNDVFAALPRIAAPSYLLQYEAHLQLGALHRFDRKAYADLDDALRRPRPGDPDGPGFRVKGSPWQPTTALAAAGLPFAGLQLEVYTGLGGRFNQTAPLPSSPLAYRGPCEAPYFIVRAATASLPGSAVCVENFPAKRPQECLRRLFDGAEVPLCRHD